MPSFQNSSRALSPRFALREATAEAHERLDRLYSCFDLSRSSDYGAFLLAQAPAFIATEQALKTAGAEEFLPGWSNRLRAACLIQDIADLSLAKPVAAAAPIFETEAQTLGAIYVLEGSRLGGAVLFRQVPDGLPTRFLTPDNSIDWRALVSILELRLNSEKSLAEAATSALAVFALFEQSAHKILEPTGFEL